MRRSSTDESTYHRSPSLDSKDYSFPNGAFRRYSSMYGGQFGAASNSFFGFHTNPGPKATKAKYTSPKGNKYVVFYLDLSFIFLLELKRCSMAHNCLQCIKYLMFVFNLLFWIAHFLGHNNFVLRYFESSAAAAIDLCHLSAGVLLSCMI
ncbi:tetraspanin-4 isoform x1 [Pitangus sulphuratus]|nr:tetraspanin-4 isoform x1 [Pitangus sulphuratus]